MIESKLKAVLFDRHVTQQELSTRTGVRLPTISDIATGKMKHIPVNVLEAICRELDCQPGDLFVFVRNKGE